MNKHFSIPFAVVWTIVLAVVTAMSVYYAQQQAQAQTYAGLDTRVSILETKQTTQDSVNTELKNKIGNIDTNVISILVRLGVPPSTTK